MVALIPNTKDMGQSEARNAVADAVVAQWGQPTDSDETPFSIEDMRQVSIATIKEIQRVFGDTIGDLSQVLWSNENGGTAGSLAKLRAAAHKVIDAGDSILGGQ